jgi:hypothetical protein
MASGGGARTEDPAEAKRFKKAQDSLGSFSKMSEENLANKTTIRATLSSIL